MTDRYGLHSYETRHTKRVRIYRVSGWAALLIIGLLILGAQTVRWVM